MPSSARPGRTQADLHESNHTANKTARGNSAAVTRVPPAVPTPSGPLDHIQNQSDRSLDVHGEHGNGDQPDAPILELREGRVDIAPRASCRIVFIEIDNADPAALRTAFKTLEKLATVPHTYAAAEKGGA